MVCTHALRSPDCVFRAYIDADSLKFGRANTESGWRGYWIILKVGVGFGYRSWRCFCSVRF
jgi:hypothetical protein